jgi:hypothetical protein
MLRSLHKKHNIQLQNKQIHQPQRRHNIQLQRKHMLRLQRKRNNRPTGTVMPQYEIVRMMLLAFSEEMI